MMPATSTPTASSTPSPYRYRTVLACTDYSALGQAAVESAVMLGRRLGSERIHLGNVVPNHTGSLMEAMATRAAHEVAFDDRNLSAQMLESLELPLTEAAVTREVRIGEPSRTLALMAGEIGADLIVVGSHGRGLLGRMILGSVAQDLVRLAPCPILILHGEDRRIERFERVVAGIDLSDLSRPVLENGLAMAGPFGAEVLAVSVFESDAPLFYGAAYGRRSSEIEIAEQRISALGAFVDCVPKGDVRVAKHVVENEVAWRGLLDDAQRSKADLIVIGSNGRNALQRVLLGSTATKLVEKSEIPLLVVPRSAV